MTDPHDSTARGRIGFSAVTLPGGEVIPMRALADGQRCVVAVYDVATATTTEVFATTELLLEAPNWTTSTTLVLNGDGVLWTLDIAGGALDPIAAPGLPALNNDHVPGVDGETMFVSGFDWHLHAVSLRTGASRPITRDDPSRPRLHFLHGVSPDGAELAYVGIEPDEHGPWGNAELYTIAADGGDSRQLTFSGKPADGPEYSPDGEWIYFNTEQFSDIAGHAQIARVPRTGGEVTQLTFDERVNWFPHWHRAGELACYLSYPPGTTGHPADQDVELRLVRSGAWEAAETVARFNGGQGTINVNSWAPDRTAFAFVSYPFT